MINQKQTGFTIIELLVVIVVIGILAAITIVAFNGISIRSRIVVVQTDLVNSAKVLESYRIATSTSDTYPSVLDCGSTPATGTICLKSSPGTSYQYTFTSASNSYCLSAVNSTIGYSISSANKSIQTSVCAGHSSPGAVVIAGITSLLAGSGAGSVDGTGASALFQSPNDIAIDATGNVLVADTYNNHVRKITPAGVVTTYATYITYPESLDFDSAGNLYITSYGDNNVVKITPAGTATVFATGFSTPRGIAISTSGDIYVADSNNNLIKKITSAGTVTIFAGSGVGSSTDGTGTAATFNGPFAIAIDSSNNLYTADYFSTKIRKITPAGVVTTIAGSTDGYADGIGSAAMFSQPSGIAVDTSGNIYVGDSANNRIRKITPTGVVTTLIGSGAAAYAEGSGTGAALNYPAGIAFGSDGTMYLADRANNRIRKVL